MKDLCGKNDERRARRPRFRRIIGRYRAPNARLARSRTKRERTRGEGRRRQGEEVKERRRHRLDIIVAGK